MDKILAFTPYSQNFCMYLQGVNTIWNKHAMIAHFYTTRFGLEVPYDVPELEMTLYNDTMKNAVVNCSYYTQGGNHWPKRTLVQAVTRN